MLKLYIYGYLNQVSTSRSLEREAQRNVEVMWLTGRLAPDFKTIADFQRDNGASIRKVCGQFVVLCRKLKLFQKAFVAIDDSIVRYLMQMESLDRQESALAQDKSQRLAEKIEVLKKETEKLKKHEAAMLGAPDQQLSLTDPDCRSMITRGTGVVGYNVQVAVDTSHHLIVAHEVTNKGSDHNQLRRMSERARKAIAADTIEAVADRGYFSNDEIKDCEEADITTYLPKPKTSNKRTKGYYSKDDFIYREQDDAYECPAGERLVKHSKTQQDGLTIHKYWSDVCGECALKANCTPGDERRVSRWKHEEFIERLQQRLDENPEMMRVRRETVEHPFGTIKH